ncbi:capsular exopolysaccharide family protein [Enterococcus faecalis RP2S-4]|uniref:Tyrosine-protein kinase CpsD n=2 Tax=Enterococcus faecalis TaxID=1351 RepID=A0ABC9TNZ3_ENTFL|nr:capsular exopolysaccharide family protein [Enterococcus faecalis RP2S-4]
MVKKRSRNVFLNKSSLVSEQLNNIRANIEFLTGQKESHSLSVTSANKGEGKSFILNNFAHNLANQNEKVILIDTDFHNPKLSKDYETLNQYGLSDVITKRVKTEDVIVPIKKDYLDLIPCGTIPPNADKILSEEYLEQIIAELKQTYQWVLLDCSPASLFLESLFVARKVDGVIIVVNAYKTTEEEVVEIIEMLKQGKDNVLGTILNNTKKTRKNYY